MKPEKAAEILLFKKGKFIKQGYVSKQEYEAINMALKALEQVPELIKAVNLVKRFRDEHSLNSTDAVDRNLYHAYNNCYMATRHLIDEWEEDDDV